MRRYVRVIANNAETRIPARGRVIFMDSTTAGVLVTARKDDTGRGDGLSVGPITMETGRKFTTQQVFDDVTVRNESGASVTITILIGEGDFDVSVAEVTIETNNNMATGGDATAGAAAVQIVAATATNRRIHIKALASNTQNVRIGDSNITITRGIQLQPGEGITLEHSQNVFAIREVAGTVQLSIGFERRI